MVVVVVVGVVVVVSLVLQVMVGGQQDPSNRSLGRPPIDGGKMSSCLMRGISQEGRGHPIELQT